MFNISLQVFLSAVWIKTMHLIWLLSQWKIITDSENLFFCHALLGINLRVKLRGWCVWAEHGPIRYPTARKWQNLISLDSHRLQPNLDKNLILHLAAFFKIPVHEKHLIVDKSWQKKNCMLLVGILFNANRGKHRGEKLIFSSVIFNFFNI